MEITFKRFRISQNLNLIIDIIEHHTWLIVIISLQIHLNFPLQNAILLLNIYIDTATIIHFFLILILFLQL